MERTIKMGWMSWEELEKYLPQLIQMEADLLVTFHYPDRKPPMEYITRSVHKLREHMANGNTYFYGIRDEERLYGYSWTYTALFIDELRWHEHSRYLVKEMRGKGFGRLLSSETEAKARSLGVASMETSVALFNDRMRALLESTGYIPTRVEMIKKL